MADYIQFTAYTFARGSIIYDLISSKNYHLAIELSNFATKDIKTYASDESRRYIILNKVISYKYGGHSEDAIKILNQEDWSSCSDKYLIAVSVLRGEFAKAAQTMKRIGDNDESIDVLAYREWPLFKEFRKTPDFMEAYKEVFKEDFVIKENVSPENAEKNTTDAANTEASDEVIVGAEAAKATPKRTRRPKCKPDVQPAAADGQAAAP